MMCSTTSRSTSRPLKSALLSAFRRSWSRNSALFWGQRPWEVLHALHWALRPTPPLKRRNGTISFWTTTFLRKRWARRRGIRLMAWAVSRVFLKCTRRLLPRALQDLVGFSGSVWYRVIFEDVLAKLGKKEGLQRRKTCTEIEDLYE